MFRQLINLIRHNPLVAHSSVFFVGTVAINLGNYLFHVVMARWLGVVSYGELQSLMSLFIIFGIPLTAVQTVIVNYAAKFHGAAATDQLFLLWRGMSRRMLKVGLLFALGIGLMSWPLKEFLHLSSPWLVVSIGLSAVITFLLVPNRSVLQGTRRFLALSVNSSIETFSKLLAGILLVGLGWSLAGAVGGVIAGAAMAYLASFIPLRDFWRSRHAPEGAAQFTISELFRYSEPVLISLLCLTLLYSTDVILAKHFLTPELAGYYSGLSIVGRIIFFLTGPVVAVMFSLSSEQAGALTSRLIMRQAMLMTLVIALGTTALYALFPRLVITVLLGTEFYEIAPWLGLFGLAMAMYSAISLLAQYFLSRHHTGFVVILVVGAVAQAAALWQWHQTLAEFVYIMNLAMALVLIGLVIYYKIIKNEPPTPLVTSLNL